MSTRLSLLCHASTSAVRASAFPADEALDDNARARLGVFSDAIRPPDRCWTSPALRARQTAEALNLDAEAQPLLRDCDYGRWTGRSFDDVQAEEPEAVSAWMRDPAVAPHGGESVIDLMRRVAGWLDGQMTSTGQVVAVTHASVIRAAVVHAIGATPRSFWRIDIAPLSLTRLSGHDSRWNLTALGPMLAGRGKPPGDR